MKKFVFFLYIFTQWEEKTLRERAEVIKENDMVKERLTMNIFICSWTLLLKYFQHSSFPTYFSSLSLCHRFPSLPFSFFFILFYCAFFFVKANVNRQSFISFILYHFLVKKKLVVVSLHPPSIHFPRFTVCTFLFFF